MAEPYYCTAAELRTELAVSSGTLPDADALKLIELAEDAIDETIGARAIDTTTGRKVLQAAVEAWQFAKLKRATLLLAATYYRDPSSSGGRRWRRISGPDFSMDGPLGDDLPPEVLRALNLSGLREPGYSIPLGAYTRDWENTIGNR